MYKLNLVGKECEITLSNESHKIVWDGRCYTIREKVVRKNKEGELQTFYDPKYYYVDLGLAIKRLALMKLLTEKESVGLNDLINKLDCSSREIISELARVLETTVSTEFNVED